MLVIFSFKFGMFKCARMRFHCAFAHLRGNIARYSRKIMKL